MRLRLLPLVCACVVLLAGSTALAQFPAKGPILTIRHDPFDFDTSRCHVTKCRNMIIRNDGDTVLVVRQMDALRAPFSANVTIPFTLQPGEFRVIPICYRPTGVRADSQIVAFRADDRIPLSIAMLFDVSASMNLSFPDAASRIEAAHAAGVSFIGSLLNTADIRDEAAVYTYDDISHYTRVLGYTSALDSLRAAIPSVANGTSTCTYQALTRTIADLATRKNWKILALLTDGDDSGPSCGSATSDSVIAEALAAGVRVYVITIGSVSRAGLEDIALATGGFYYSAKSKLDLVSIYRNIATRASQDIPDTLVVKGRGVSPELSIEPLAFDFDTVRVGQTKCLPITVRNQGNAYLHLDSVRRVVMLPYDLRVAGDSLAPGTSVTGVLCYTPTEPRTQQPTFAFRVSACDDTQLFLPMSAIAVSDSLRGVRYPVLRVEWTAPPDDTTFCNTTECRQLRFVNEGDTVLVVHESSALIAPFAGDIPVPFTLQPKESRLFEVCYHPSEAPQVDTQRVDFVADSRIDQAIGLVLDVSDSMNVAWQGGSARLAMQRSAALESIRLMLDNRNARDVGALFAFSHPTSFRELVPMTNDRFALRDSLPRVALGTIGCVSDALVRAMVAMRGVPQRKVLLLFTSGEHGGGACGALNADQVKSQARLEGFRIFICDLGTGDAAMLQDLARTTGGAYARPTTLSELFDAVYGFHQRFMERAQLWASVRGRAVVPKARVLPDTLQFGTVKAGTRQCLTIEIGNDGDAPLTLLGVEGPRAPYSMTGDIATQIQPGQPRSLHVCFEPASAGTFADSIRFTHNGCETGSLVVHLRGRATSDGGDTTWTWTGSRWKTPRFALDSDTVDMGALPCGTGETCIEYSVHNTGDSSLAFTAVSLPGEPFRHERPTNVVILPADRSYPVRVCYTVATGESRSDTSRVLLRSTTRLATSTSLVLDAAATTLGTPFDGPVSVHHAMRYAAGMYIQNMIVPDGRPDELTVSTYDDATLRLFHDWDTTRSALQVALPDTATAATSCLRSVLLGAIVDAGRRDNEARIVVALAGSDHACTDTPSDSVLIAAARLRDVRLFVVALAAPTLSRYQSICDSTGGHFAHASDRRTLDDAMQDIAHVVGRDRLFPVVLRARTVVPELVVDEDSLDFGRVATGAIVCRLLRLRVTGEAPVTNIRISGGDVGGTPVVLPMLAAGSDTTLRVCMQRATAGNHRSNIMVTWQGCTPDTTYVPTRIATRDSLLFYVEGRLRVDMGSVVRVPIRMRGSLYGGEALERIRLTLATNKTVLAPQPLSHYDREGAFSIVFARDSITHDKMWTWDRLTVTTDIRVGAPFRLTDVDTLFIRTSYLPLLGNATWTDVELTDAVAEPWLPIGVRSDMQVAIDGICWHDARLVEGMRAGILSVHPHPVATATTVRFRVAEEGQVRVSLLNALGVEVRALHDGVLGAGDHTRVLDMASLASGVYLLRFSATGIESIYRIVHL